jgi:Zn finger protein HypA/HybF involved in hydrogenase expression
MKHTITLTLRCRKCRRPLPEEALGESDASHVICPACGFDNGPQSTLVEKRMPQIANEAAEKLLGKKVAKSIKWKK